MKWMDWNWKTSWDIHPLNLCLLGAMIKDDYEVSILDANLENHTPEQLTDRLLASANNDWFTPDGNTTFTTHGASVKHGYNDTWGHGVPDMYAALSPITSNGNPASASSFGFASVSTSASGTSSGSVSFSYISDIC